MHGATGPRPIVHNLSADPYDYLLLLSVTCYVSRGCRGVDGCHSNLMAGSLRVSLWRSAGWTGSLLVGLLSVTLTWGMLCSGSSGVGIRLSAYTSYPGVKGTKKVGT